MSNIDIGRILPNPAPRPSSTRSSSRSVEEAEVYQFIDRTINLGTLLLNPAFRNSTLSTVRSTNRVIERRVVEIQPLYEIDNRTVNLGAILPNPGIRPFSAEYMNLFTGEEAEEDDSVYDHFWSDSDFEYDSDDEDEEMEDVVRPVPMEVIEKLPLLKLNRDHVSSIQDCPICCETFQVNEEAMFLKCNHFYHTQCIKQWFEFQNMCPLCRQTVV